MSVFRFVIITQDDPFYVRVFFEAFLRDHADLTELQGVVIAPAMGKKTLADLLRQMFRFYGPIDFVRVGMRYVLYRAAGRLPKWLRAGRSFSVAQVCSSAGVRVTRVGDLNSAEFISALRSMDLDLVVSVAAPQVFKEPLYSLPRLGCINIHSSKLPKYRGMLPNFWQMFNGEAATGTTIHRINAGIDDGEVLFQCETPRDPSESLETLIIRTKRAGSKAMAEMIGRFKSGTVVALPKSPEEPTYYTFPNKAQVREFRRRGYRLL
jgi:methionyl-tRNA formyltransferase